jgi:hypothetical protein
MTIFSVESPYGGRALVRADDIEEVKDALDAARSAGRGATLVRNDGEPVVVYPEFVFLIGEPGPPNPVIPEGFPLEVESKS